MALQTFESNIIKDRVLLFLLLFLICTNLELLLLPRVAHGIYTSWHNFTKEKYQGINHVCIIYQNHRMTTYTNYIKIFIHLQETSFGLLNRFLYFLYSVEFAQELWPAGSLSSHNFTRHD